MNSSSIINEVIKDLDTRSNTFTIPSKVIKDIGEIGFEYSYLKTNYSLWEIQTIKKILKETNRINRDISILNNIICDNRFIFEKYRLISSKGTEVQRVEFNYILCVIPLLYTEMGYYYEGIDGSSDSSKIKQREQFIILNLLTGLIVNCISKKEYQLLMDLLCKDTVLESFINENRYYEQPQSFRNKIITLLYNIYSFISNNIPSNVTLKSMSDFRFIYYIQNSNTSFDTINSFTFTTNNNGVSNIIKPKVFFNNSLIGDYYKELFGKKPRKTSSNIILFE